MNIQKTKHAKVDFNCLCFLWKTKQKSRELRFENKLPFFQLSLRFHTTLTTVDMVEVLMYSIL